MGAPMGISTCAVARILQPCWIQNICLVPDWMWSCSNPSHRSCPSSCVPIRNPLSWATWALAPAAQRNTRASSLVINPFTLPPRWRCTAPLLPENKSPLLSFPSQWGIFKTTLSCGLSILGLWDTYSRNHLEKHLSNVRATLLKCRLWYNRWADGAELCIPRKLAGGPVAAQWGPLIWTILLK